MITEDYVSFETAKLLKEKGFDSECNCFYVSGDIVRARGGKCNWNEGETIFTDYKNECSAPTLQMAMKWLREVHNIDINIYAESVSHKKRYTISMWKNIQDDDAINDFILNVSTIYEEACEAAIKYCLENLI